MPPGRLRDGLRRAAAALVLVVPALAVGAAVAVGIATTPAAIQISPGFSARIAPALADHLTVSYGPSFGFPEVGGKSVGGVHLNAVLEVTQFATHNQPDGTEALAALFSDSSAFTSSVGDVLAQRVRAAAIAGAVVFTLVVLVFVFVRRWRRTKAQERQERLALVRDIDAAGALPADLAQANRAALARLRHVEQRRARRAPWLWVVAAVVAAAVTAGSAVAIRSDLNGLRPVATSRTVLFPSNATDPLLAELESDAPLLRGAFVTGNVGYYVKKAIRAAVDKAEKVNDYWKQAAQHVVSDVLPQLREQGALSWQDDPNIVSFVHLSDIHDNRPYLLYFLPAVLKALRPDFVVNTGDEMNYSGTLFLDRGAWQRFADALPAGTDAVVVTGNHDDPSLAAAPTEKAPGGTSRGVLFPLDGGDDYTKDVDGLTFVGSPDPNRTTPSGTVPDTREKQIANAATQGKTIAKRACEVYRKTGRRPVVLAHEREATYAAIAEGCAMLALSGHLHVTLPVQAFLNQDGSLTYQQNIGSASGDGPNNTVAIYNGPTKTGEFGIWLYDKLTGQLVDYTIEISIDPNSPPAAQVVDLPTVSDAAPAADDAVIRGLLDRDDPAALPAPAQRPTGAPGSPALTGAPPAPPVEPAGPSTAGPSPAEPSTAGPSGTTETGPSSPAAPPP